jgi:hypothetical protein
MTKSHMLAESPTPADRRVTRGVGRTTLAGVGCREEDIEPTRALHSVAILFRVMSGMLLLLMVLQVFNGLASTLEISYGVLAAEAVRLLIYAGLLWGASDLADLSVKSHCDLRAVRVLLGRIAHLAGPAPAGSEGDTDTGRARPDASH